jgi:hypothetical protein
VCSFGRDGDLRDALREMSDAVPKVTDPTTSDNHRSGGDRRRVRDRGRAIRGDVAELHTGPSAGVDQRTDHVERGASAHLPAVTRMGHRAGTRIP